MHITAAIDTVLDRSVVPGYSRIGPALRRRWWPADPPPGSMAGRRVLVTGAETRLGAATIAGLSRLGAEVHGHGEPGEVMDPAGVRRFAAGFAERVDRLDALVHTPGGQETAFPAAVLAPHLLTDLLRGPLAKAGGIVVFGCSSADASLARMQVTLAQLWGERLRADGIAVASVHPGWLDSSDVAGDSPVVRTVAAALTRTPGQGADTAVWLVATRPRDAGTGRFWHDRRERSTGYGFAGAPVAAQRQQLWNRVAQATETAPWDPAWEADVAARRFDFAFEPAYRLPALLFGVTPVTAQVWLDEDELRVRFGPWRLRTPRVNIASWTETGDFAFLKTAGPAHLSLADHGVTFATNSKHAVCVRFHRPVSALDPTGRLRHPGATMTVADPQAFGAALESDSGRTG